MTHDESLKPGSSLADGKFIVDKLIAKGGFSYIYEGRIIYRLAVDNEFVSIKAEEKPVVIKELYISEKSRRESDGITLRWNDENELDEKNRLSYRIKNKTRNEALKLCLLKSPHILKLIGAFEENNTIYQITEKIEGAVDFHKRQGLSAEKIGTKLSVFDAVRYITQISEALKEVHGKNIVHLDIKPENILCDHKDNAILIDFGISMTIGEKTGKSAVLSAASCPWAPPEQYNTKDTVAISFASDIYSLGQTFYAFLTGVIPPDFSEVTSGSAILQSPSEYNKDVTHYLDEVVFKCIQSNRDKRYQTIEEFLFALQGKDDYKVLIDKAEKAEQNEEYERAIHLLNESEKYIPLSSKLLELRYEYQRKLEEQQKKGENKRKEEEVLKLVNNGDFEKALSILELLPFNAHIRQQMEKCRQGISLRKKKELIDEAENLIEEKQYESALSKYQEAKVIDQSDVAIDRSIEKLQKILQDIEKNKKYNEFIAIGDEAFKKNELKEALEAYKLAKENVTLSSLTIDERIKTCVIALSERNEMEKAKDDTAKALAIVKEKPLLEIAEQELATEIECNISKLNLINDFKAKYPLSDAFHEQMLASQARAKELEELRLYFKAKTENDKREYKVALKTLTNISSPTLKEKVTSLQKEIENVQKIAEAEALKKEIEDLIEKNNFQAVEKSLLKLKKVDKLLSASLQTTLDHKKLIYATLLNDEGDCKIAISLLQTIGAQSPSYDEAQKILDAIKNKKQVADNETKIIKQAEDAINKKNYQAATTLLNDIPSSSTSYGQVTQLFSTIDKEQFDEAKLEWDKRNLEKALAAFQAIHSRSAYYKEEQRHIRILERQIEEQRYQALLSEALQKVEAKNYKKARMLLAQIPDQSTVDVAKANLLQLITSKEKSRKKTQKVVWIALVSVVAVFALVWCVVLLDNTEKISESIVAEETVPNIPVQNEEKKIENDLQITIKQEKRDQVMVSAEKTKETKRENIANGSSKPIIDEKKYIPHQLKSGETLYSISRLYNVASAEILASNPGISENFEVGRIIYIPRKEDENRTKALLLLREADALFAKGSYDIACDKYVQANRLSVGVGNVGAAKFEKLAQELSFDKDAPAYKNNLIRANKIRNAR